MQDEYHPTTEWGLQVADGMNATELVRRTSEARAMSLRLVDGRAYGLVVDAVGAHFLVVNEAGALVGAGVEVATGSYTSGALVPTSSGFLVFLVSPSELTMLTIGRDGLATAMPVSVDAIGGFGLAAEPFEGDYLVAFGRLMAPGGYRVLRVTEAGVVVGAPRELAANSYTSRPTLAIASGRALVAYHSQLSTDVLRAQVLDADLGLVGTLHEIEYDNTHPSNLRHPVAAVHDGSFLVAWLDEHPEDPMTSSTAHVSGRRISLEGVDAGGALRLVEDWRWDHPLTRFAASPDALTLIANGAWPRLLALSGCF